MASPEETALRVLEQERYVVLATADGGGLPWASPVYFAHVGLEQVLWLSRPYRLHSQNLAERADLALVVFDSRQAPATGLAVYARGTAAAVPDEELAEALAPYSERSVADGLGAWPPERLADPPVRLYRAVLTEVSLLPGEGTDDRVPIRPGRAGSGRSAAP